MRRSEYDVTDEVQTTDAGAVRAAVVDVFRGLYEDRAPAGAIERGFGDIERLYRGAHPDYHSCDTSYHDIQHVLEVTLAMARLMDGYERARRLRAPALGPRLFELGVLAALFHDVGYLRRRADHRHHYGAEYTLIHVSRGAAFLRRYLERAGLTRDAAAVAELLHYTGYERAPDPRRIGSPALQRIGYMLGTADIIAQMADRCYLEKCRDRLYPEFVLGGLARRSVAGGRTQVMFRSGEDLVHKTPGFYRNAATRLESVLAHAYEYVERHFSGPNLYLEAMRKNVEFAQRVAETRDDRMLRRRPPATLAPGVRPFPEALLARAAG